MPRATRIPGTRVLINNLPAKMWLCSIAAALGVSATPSTTTANDTAPTGRMFNPRADISAAAISHDDNCTMLPGPVAIGAGPAFVCEVIVTDPSKMVK